MLYRKLPRIKEELSILGFGCMRLPTQNGVIDEPEAIRMFHHAVDNGINYFDAAWPYHGGLCEAFVGRGLKGIRDKVQLVTKLPTWLIKKKEDMMDYLDRQLAYLQTDHLDIYLLHSLFKDRWLKMQEVEALEFMEKAKAAGKIRYIGFSFHDGLDTFKHIVDAYKWDICQIQYNLLDERFQAGTEGLKYAHSKDIGVIVMEPLKGGNITTSIPQDLSGAVQAANYTASTFADLGLRWVWDHQEVGVVLSGMSTMDQLKQNIASASKGVSGGLTAAERELAAKARDFYQERMRVPCTACAYCKPCPVGVDIPQCFTNLNNASISGNWEAQKMNYNYLLAPDREGKRASTCVECGACEPKCPQSIPIRAKLKEVVKAFES